MRSFILSTHKILVAKRKEVGYDTRVKMKSGESYEGIKGIKNYAIK